MSRSSYTVRPPGPPKGRAGKVAALSRFIENRIAAVGDVTDQALKAAGFKLDEVEELSGDVRERLARRGIGGFAG